MAQTTAADGVSTGFKGYAGIFTQRRKYDLSDKVVYKGRVHAKMLNILSRNLTKMATTEIEPRIFEFSEFNDVITLNNNAGTGTTFDIANADAQVLQENDILSIVASSITSAPTIENVTVVSVGAEDGGSGAGYTSVTVRRESSPINITTASDYKLVWLGNAVEENGAGSAAVSKEPNYVYNYLQLFDETIAESKDVANSEFYAKQFFAMNARATRRRDFLMRKINHAFYLGKRDRETAGNGHYRHKTGGILEWIPSGNKQSMSGKMTVEDWNTYATTTWFPVGNDRHEKWLAAGPQFHVKLENMFSQYYQLKVNETLSKFYGIQVKTLEMSGGTLNIFREDVWYGSGLTNCGFILDGDYLAYMYLRNRDIQIERGTVNNSEKWNKDEMKIFGRVGLFRSYANAHHLLYDPSAPA